MGGVYHGPGAKPPMNQSSRHSAPWILLIPIIWYLSSLTSHASHERGKQGIIVQQKKKDRQSHEFWHIALPSKKFKLRPRVSGTKYFIWRYDANESSTNVWKRKRLNKHKMMHLYFIWGRLQHWSHFELNAERLQIATTVHALNYGHCNF